MEKRELICIGCPLGCPLTVTMEETGITVTGNTCKRGEIYAKKEALGIFAQDFFAFYFYFTAPVQCCPEGWGFQR